MCSVLANRKCAPKRHEHMSCFTYRLVAKQDVDVRHDLHQGLLKELADERRWEVHAEDFVVIWSVLRHLQDRIRGHGQEKTLKGGIIFTYIRFSAVWLTSAEPNKLICTVPLYRRHYLCFDSTTWARMDWTTASYGLKHFKLLICGFWSLTRQF